MMQYFTGIPVSPGLVIGRCLEVKHRTAGLSRVLQTPQDEQRIFEAARILAQGELETLIRRADTTDQKEILGFQHAVLEDVTFLDYVNDAIKRELGALGAVQAALVHFASAMRQLNDSYFQARGADIEDVGHRLCDILAGENHDHLTLRTPTVLVAENLFPSDLVSIDRRFLLGVVVANGSPQSHAAIIARTLGIPAVVLAGQGFLEKIDGREIALDGNRGEFYLEPDPTVRARFEHQIRLARRRTLYLESLRSAPCVTRDGIHISLQANSSDPDDIRMALAMGAEGIGLVRSEFLFIEEHMPGEAEQLAFYQECLKAADGKPLTIRTIDVGADKDVAGLSAENEANPALGLRGIRLSLACENLLLAQFRALLRASAYGPLQIMLPMIDTPQDLQAAMRVLEKAKTQLRNEERAFDETLPVGIMIETPCAALLSDQLAREAAFFSIGTNDLTQYTLAADRTNPAVSAYYKPDSLAVMRLVEMTIRNADAAGIPVGICGESAAVPSIAARYVRLGARCLSMAGPSIAEVKDALRNITALSPEDSQTEKAE